MIKISKRYIDIPFAHRQPNHDGHCALIHGHNWALELEFEGKSLDENGFVLDFGKFKPLKKWMEENLDHAIVVAEGDEETLNMIKSYPHLFKPLIVPLPSCEGLAQYLYQVFTDILMEQFPRMRSGEVIFTAIRIWEDSKNFAVYQPYK